MTVLIVACCKLLVLLIPSLPHNNEPISKRSSHHRKTISKLSEYCVIIKAKRSSSGLSRMSYTNKTLFFSIEWVDNFIRNYDSVYRNTMPTRGSKETKPYRKISIGVLPRYSATARQLRPSKLKRGYPGSSRTTPTNSSGSGRSPASKLFQYEVSRLDL